MLQQEYIAKTISGLEEVLAEELVLLGAVEIKTLKRAVGFRGDLALLYTANLWCRTALRILKPLFAFQVNSNEELYKQVLAFNWEDIFSVDQTFAIDSVINDSVFTHSHFVSQKVKDAVADHFRNVCGSRPTVNTENPDIRINVRIYKTDCNISLDSSGESLHKRGYRDAGGIAPMSEVLAAGLIKLSGWDATGNFIDPMCGSGTLLIEAALMAKNIAPGSFRKSFCFMKWKDFNPGLWENLLRKAREGQTSLNCKICGSDNSDFSINIAKENIRNARLQKDISIELAEFENHAPPTGGGTMIMNPPYGERLQEEDIVAFYKSIGDGLKKNYSGYDAWIISSDLNALKFIGLRPSRKIPVFNGPLECRFYKFSIYSGSKKVGGNSRATQHLSGDI